MELSSFEGKELNMVKRFGFMENGYNDQSLESVLEINSLHGIMVDAHARVLENRARDSSVEQLWT